MVGLAAEYNSVRVNTLCRSLSGLNSPVTRGTPFGGRSLFNPKETLP
jgi:hypothetical protein